MQETQRLFLFQYKQLGPLRWLHVTSTDDDGRSLAGGQVEAAPPNANYSLLLRATVSDDVRRYLCAWELYRTSPDVVPFSQLGEFEAAWRRLRVDYLAHPTESGGRVVFWDREHKSATTNEPKRKRGRPRKTEVAARSDAPPAES